MTRFHLHKARQNRAHAELRSLAAVNAGEQRVGKTIHEFRAVMAFDKFGNALILARPLWLTKPLAHHAQLGNWREQTRKDNRQHSGRHHENQAVRDREQPAFNQNVCFALGVVRNNQFVTESQFAAKISRPGLFCKE